MAATAAMNNQKTSLVKTDEMAKVFFTAAFFHKRRKIARLQLSDISNNNYRQLFLKPAGLLVRHRSKTELRCRIE